MFQALNQGNELEYEDVQSRPGHIRRSIPPSTSAAEPEENTHLLIGIRPSRKQVYEWTHNEWKRILVLNVLPVAVVLAWCAIPLPTYDPNDINDINNNNNNNNDITLNQHQNQHSQYLLLNHFSNNFNFNNNNNNNNNNNLDNNLISNFNNDNNNNFEKPLEINFWYFLFFYYGFYNAIALLMITKVFDLYSLNWWPKWLGGGFAYCIFWIFSLFLGALIYLYTGLEKFNLTWVLLTFFTMNMPLLVAFIVIKSQNRNTYRHSMTIFQKTFLERQLDSRIPASYRRFLWFCFTLFIIISAFIAGEAYAYVFISTPSAHTGIDAFVYVYSWLATIYILDTVTEYIIETRVKSYPLQFSFKLYFFMIYFIFYRNLFARLRNPKQYILIQAASSLWVCIFYPICMTRKMHKALVYFLGLRKDYEEYKKQCGRSFFIRNLAENATMLGFICWICIIHYGPNYDVYPYFKFNEEGNEFNFDYTLRASCYIWAFELASTIITRLIYTNVFQHNISKEAVKDFEAYPEMVVALIVIIIHVLQDMLMALLSLNFQGGHSGKNRP
ncbi:hypothetical protein Glove_750g35 [Diversispora epigaea]|uniref:Transmembrane protein n=1 Tax=Diversispora epigaea TaxID=1348612 RepID=A0A397G824_9GLOM|nr:hypothetical protein Glove_750g35 [Diversispora epigaea]